MTKKEQIQTIIGQVINMYRNNVLNDYGNECFLGWINDGEVWQALKLTDKENDNLMVITERIAPLVDALTQEIENILDEKTYHWVCRSNDHSFEDESECFETFEECFNNMRQQAVNKMLWNTEIFDLEDDIDSYISYDVQFHRNGVIHESYSGVYLYRIFDKRTERKELLKELGLTSEINPNTKKIYTTEELFDMFFQKKWYNDDPSL